MRAGARLDQHVDERRGHSGEVAPLVDERAIDRDARRDRGADGEEIPAAAQETVHVGAEVEDVAVGRLALERDGAVGRGGDTRRPRREARGRGRDVGRAPASGGKRSSRLERVIAAEAGSAQTVTAPFARRSAAERAWSPPDLCGGHARARAVGGGPGEAPAVDERREAGIDLARAIGGLLGELRQPAQRDERDRILGRGGGRGEEGAGPRRRRRGRDARGAPPRGAPTDPLPGGRGARDTPAWAASTSFRTTSASVARALPGAAAGARAAQGGAAGREDEGRRGGQGRRGRWTIIESPPRRTPGRCGPFRAGAVDPGGELAEGRVLRRRDARRLGRDVPSATSAPPRGGSAPPARRAACPAAAGSGTSTGAHPSGSA